MSKLRRPFFLVILALVQALMLPGGLSAQDMMVTIKVESGVLSIYAEITQPAKGERVLYISTGYPGNELPEDRLSDLAFRAKTGITLKHEKISPGRLVTDGEFSSWSYTINPGSPIRSASSAHVSWLNGEQGLLMLDDLLLRPSEGRVSARIKFVIPAGWKVGGPGGQASTNIFDVADVEKAVFFIGKDWREIKGRGGKPDVVIAGDWLFTDDEAANMAGEIFANNAKLFDAAPPDAGRVIISKFPRAERPGTWEAETRGSSVVIVSADMPFQTQSVQKLHEQLRHEIFHLWVPNAVDLSGNYDWFYEGFALYQSLRAGVGANRIRFDDMLDTLSRAYNIDNFPDKRSSLLDASKDRWAGGNTTVYARGMLVAFLCDIVMLERSKGKRSISDVLKQIFAKYRSGAAARQDGSDAVLRELGSYEYLKPVIDRYIKGSEQIAWKTDLDAVGLAAEEGNSTVRLKVKDKPSGRQKAFLDKLGYNNWRKMSPGSK